MGDSHPRELLRIIERAAANPLLAYLPAAVGYRIACWRGDWLYRCQARNRAEIARNLESVLGNKLGPGAVQRVTRESFRLASCAMVDALRLRHKARPMRRLFEIRGREHLEAALAGGSGAILCTGHFGSHGCGFSVLHAAGFPVTTIGRNWYNYVADMSSIERRLWRFYDRPVLRLRQRPNIEPRPGRPETAALAAVALRAGEVVTIAIDAAPLEADRTRLVEVPFLGRHARMLPGAVVLAQLTGAPLLMGFVHRAADYRHQVLEISAPIPVDGGIAAAFERCAAELSAAIMRSPAHWDTWSKTEDLIRLGLIEPQQDASVGTEVSDPGKLSSLR